MTDDTSIKFFGTTWCPSSRRVKEVLIKRGIAFDWINIDEDLPGCEFVMKINHGNRSVPTILFPDGDILVEPSIPELSTKLSKLGL